MWGCLQLAVGLTVGRYFYGHFIKYSLALEGGGTEWTHGLSLPFMAGTTQTTVVGCGCQLSLELANCT